MKHVKMLLVAMSVLVLTLTAEARKAACQASTISVSGTITQGGVPVAGMAVSVWWDSGSADLTTDTQGAYHHSQVPAGSSVGLSVNPPASSRLVPRYWNAEGGAPITADLKKDFELQQGYLLSGTVFLPNGQPFVSGSWMQIYPISLTLPEGEFFGCAFTPDTGSFEGIVPPGIHGLEVSPLPSTGYWPSSAVDLRQGDVTGLEIVLSSQSQHPIPYDPPDASLVTFGAPDDLGEATVAGAAGAALPLAHVFLVNLNSGHQGHAASEPDGSFQARLFAPPGSAVMIKHGPASWRWNDLGKGVSEGVNPFPGTIVLVPYAKQAGSEGTAFATAGAVQAAADDLAATRNFVGAAWSVAGSMEPVKVEGKWSRILTGTYGGNKTPGLYLGGLNWTHPALGDLDGDGDLDLLVGEERGSLVFYRNTGTRKTPRWQFVQFGYADVETGWWPAPALADATGDGAPDLFVGTGDGRVLIYYNEGTAALPVWPAKPSVTLIAGQNAAPALADLDGDGDLDLVVGHQGGTLHFFRNTGSPSNPSWSLVTTAFGSISEPDQMVLPAFLDADGDGDLDLLLGRCGDLVWYRNDGPPANPAWTRIEEGFAFVSGSCAISPAVGDWDADGDRDLVFGQHWGELCFFRNDGPPAWTSRSYAFPFELMGDSAPALADLDGDDDLDLLVGQAHGNVHFYLNQGSAAAADWHEQGVIATLPWANHPHAFPALADIDGDGDYDLFVGEGGWQSEAGAGGNIHYYRNDGTPGAHSWTLVTTHFLDLDVGGWATPALVDIDADGDLDLFVGDEAGSLTFIENTGAPGSPLWAAPISSYANLSLGAYSAPAFLDMDGDGDLDLVSGRGDGALAYVRNDGSPSSPDWTFITMEYPGLNTGSHSLPAAADLDGDGHADLLLGDGDGGLNLYLYKGPGAAEDETRTFRGGDVLNIQGELRLYSPAISAATSPDDLAVSGSISLRMLFNAAGRSVPAQNYFTSSLLTPTGLPIQHAGNADQWLEVGFEVSNWRRTGDHSFAGDLLVTCRLPENVLPGVYRPILHLSFSGVPTDTTWLAANVVSHTYCNNHAVLPPLTVGKTAPPHLIFRLLMDDFVQGVHGAGAREDRKTFNLTSQIVTHGAEYAAPRVDPDTGKAISYRLEPFLPTISFTDRRMPAPPLLPLDLPGGRLTVSIRQPDGMVRKLGSAPFKQSFNRTKTTRAGYDLNGGTVQMEDVYSLTTVKPAFRTTFSQYGHHVVTMKGSVKDIWGNRYQGGGTYDVWVAEPIHIYPAVLPGTPFEVGDHFNPSLQLYPAVPAAVSMTLTLLPHSDPAKALTYAIEGKANEFGLFSPTHEPLTLSQPGEFRVDLVATYTDSKGTIFRGSMTWGNVVETPGTPLLVHGRRGTDNLQHIPDRSWFFLCRDLEFPEGSVGHSFNPYFNGDILWSRMKESEACGGDALVLGASIQDTAGEVEAAIRSRADFWQPPVSSPGTLAERFNNAEIPLFISTVSGRPPQLAPEEIDQMAYSYRSSQRPGVRVREVVTDDAQSGGYWRLDTLYDDQLGVGIQGDLPNDFKFQYLGAVYRDLERKVNQYAIQGGLWVFIPDDDPGGSRLMPPFAGRGNGGWTTDGGPILKLKGEDIDMFILPTGTLPGSVLEVGDLFRFSGHLAPTLNSQVKVKVTSPSGKVHNIRGQANKIGYFYDPTADFAVDEPGAWAVDVTIWHDGECSGGPTIAPYPSGNVLGSEGGRYWFYAVPDKEHRLPVGKPANGFLKFTDTVAPIKISGSLPAGITGGIIDYTITMPGYILEHGQVQAVNGKYQFVFDPVTLNRDFPNLDLLSRQAFRAGLSDTFAIGLLLKGREGENSVYYANSIIIEGDRVFVGKGPFKNTRSRSGASR